MFPPKKILFPVDFSDRCTDAARMVETLAGHFQAKLAILHVIQPLTYNDLPVDTEGLEEDQLKTYLADEFKHFDVERVLMRGDPGQRIVEYAHSGKFDLIMLPTHGYGRFRRFIIGSVTAKVLHDADCAVWTGVHMEAVPRLEDIAFRRLACAIDLDDTSSCRALRWATQFAFEFDAAITIVHAIPAAKESANVFAFDEVNKELVRAATQKIEAMQNSVGSEADVSIMADEVPHAVSDAAARAKADLLVIGRSAERGVIGRLRTNAYSIIRQSPCPVISV
jgi:nucleotide-binding universal stress UspA family protein